uniref:Uncharacterized protein n=1 Tax=Arundo donax TaxID=35708 RepID=A0A0A8YDR7_ARUDO
MESWRNTCTHTDRQSATHHGRACASAANRCGSRSRCGCGRGP